jgi:serine/threonine protein phosphatase PrpC
MILRHAARTHPGLVRANNEDAFVVLPRGAVVADGVGGGAAGEVASGIAVAVIGKAIAALAADTPADVVVQALRSGFREAAAECARHVAQDRRAAGMATTVVACWVGTGIWVRAHLGDSRAYVLRRNRTAAVTRDHSPVMDLVSSGVLSRDEARTHPLSHKITRALSPTRDAEPEIRVMPIMPGDRLALMSDGATDLIPEGEFCRIARFAPTAHAAVDEIEAAALVAGGRDNITVVVIDVE